MIMKTWWWQYVDVDNDDDCSNDDDKSMMITVSIIGVWWSLIWWWHHIYVMTSYFKLTIILKNKTSNICNLFIYLFILFSIYVIILYTGEKMKVHDEDAERAAEIAKEAAAGGDIGIS